jgi:hypothetical protein
MMTPYWSLRIAVPMDGIPGKSLHWLSLLVTNLLELWSAISFEVVHPPQGLGLHLDPSSTAFLSGFDSLSF